MKKRLLALSALVLSSTGLFAQQDMLSTHFMFNKMTFNPAATGIEPGICGSLLYRNQWDRVNGAPNSAVLNAEANLYPFGINGGAGLVFTHDAIGFNRQNNLLLNYSHHIILPQVGTIGIGAGLGIVNLGASPVWVPPVTLIDPNLPASSSATTLDVNGGLYFKSALIPLYVGLSSTHLSAPALGQQSIISAANAVNYDVKRHYYLMAGYSLENLFGTGQHLKFQTLVRTELQRFSGDINVQYVHRNIFYAGATYRTFDAAALMAGITQIPGLPNFTVGYSYDFTLNRLNTVSKGSHEIMLKYCYYIPNPPRTPSKNPRYL